jgi:polyisoprenoid-binding protein YceI
VTESDTLQEHATAARLVGAGCRKKRHVVKLLVVWAASLLLGVVASAQQRAIEGAKSAITVRVFKSGLFSSFGHDHQISAPIAGGNVDTAAGKVELRINAATMQVRDPGGSDKDHGQIQTTMLGPEVLDAARFPEIIFRSTSAEPAGADSWNVHGNLTLHGQTNTVDVEVHKSGERYTGSARFKQTAFGIKPVKVAGGAVRVKDEVRIEFDIQVAH